MDDKVKKEIQEIAAANDGKITPNMVLAAAQQPGSALYDYFETRGVWDPIKARRAYGLIIARECIRSCKIQVITKQFPVEVPWFIRDPERERKTQGYIAIIKLRNDEDLARDALIEEFARAGAAMKRAQQLAVALGLESEVQEIRDRIEIVARTVEEHPPGPAQ